MKASTVMLLLSVILSNNGLTGQPRYFSYLGFNDFADHFISTYGVAEVKSLEESISWLSTDSLNYILEEVSDPFFYGTCYGENAVYSNERCNYMNMMALLSYRELVLREEASRDTYYYCAKVKKNLGLNQEAIVDYTNALSKKTQSRTKDYSIIEERGVLKVEMNDFYGGIEDITKAIELLNKSTDPLAQSLLLPLYYYNRGKAYVNVKKYQLGYNDLSESIRRGSLNHRFAYYWRGLANIGLNRKEEGCRDFSKAMELGNGEAYDAIVKYCN